MLKNAYLDAKIGVDPAENEPSKVCSTLRVEHRAEEERWSDPTLEGSFSAKSSPNFASKYAFFNIFRDLQDSKPFAPLQTQNFAKF